MFGDDYFLLYVFSVALIAITFGWWFGVVVGLSVVVFIIVWVELCDVVLAAIGWVVYVVLMFVLGLLFGRVADWLRWAEVECLWLEVVALLHREAIEINDSLVQGMAAVRWFFQAGQVNTKLKI